MGKIILLMVSVVLLQAIATGAQDDPLAPVWSVKEQVGDMPPHHRPAVDCSSLLQLPICPVAFETDVATLINQIRSDSGRGPLAWDYRLFVGARCHSTDMVVNGCFTHSDCDGTGWTERYLSQGYSNLRGENIGGGFSTPSQVVNGWMTDSLRRQTLLDAASKHLGIGYVHGGTYTHYWTAAFGAAIDTVRLPCGCCQGVTGNVNTAGIVDLSDLSALVSYLTGGGYVLPCPAEANVNATGIVDLSDLSALVSYLTAGGYVLPDCP